MSGCLKPAAKVQLLQTASPLSSCRLRHMASGHAELLIPVCACTTGQAVLGLTGRRSRSTCTRRAQGRDRQHQRQRLMQEAGAQVSHAQRAAFVAAQLLSLESLPLQAPQRPLHAQPSWARVLATASTLAASKLTRPAWRSRHRELGSRRAL